MTCTKTTTQQDSAGHIDAHRFIQWAFAVSCILLPASIYTFYTTHAQLALIPLILSTSGVLAEGAWLLTYSHMKKGNIYKFPYGTKKLENALAVLDASFILLGVIYGLFEISRSIISDRCIPDLKVTSCLFLIGLIGGCVIFFQVAKARRHHVSPAIDVFYNIYRFAVLRDLSTLILISFVSFSGLHSNSCLFWSDIAISGALLLILGYRSARIVLNNFTALIELPLPEKDQLLILQALAPDLEKMDNIGNIRTMKRGNTRVIEVEASFPHDMRNHELLQIQENTRSRLKNLLQDVDFHLILCK